MIVQLKDFSHLFMGDDATLAVLEALRVCKQNSGSTLKLGGGELHFYPQYAFGKEYYISNNDYSRKAIAFPLISMKNFVLDGEGAQLYFHGEILPIVIDGSEDIQLMNFSVDYPHPFFFQGEIAASSENMVEFVYDTKEFGARALKDSIEFYCEEDGWHWTKSRILVTEFDVQTKGPHAYISPYIAILNGVEDTSFLRGMCRQLKAEQVSEDRIRLTGDFKQKHTPGNMWVCTFAGRECPGIFGTRSKDIRLSDIQLYHTASMGVICQLCENVSLTRVNALVRPESGRYLSVSADATHFVNCSGHVKYESCKFVSMLDDGGNIHGIYTRIDKKIDAHTLLLAFGHHQQEGILLFDKGDKVSLVNNVTMQSDAQYTVKDACLISGKFLRLELEEELGDIQPCHVVENVTKMPELTINNCECGNNRPRGFLIQTPKKAVFTNNLLYNMYCGVQIEADADSWYESGAVENVLIENNRFMNSAYAGGNAIQIRPHIKDKAYTFEKNITIRGNLFEMHDKRFLTAGNVDGLIFEGNRYIHNPALPSHGNTGSDGVLYENCTNVRIEPTTNILFQMKDLLPYGAPCFSAWENQLSLTAICAGSGLCTPPFQSIAEQLQLAFSGKLQPGTDLQYIICSYDEKHAKTQCFSENIKPLNETDFHVTFTFDTISLAVYKNAVEFQVIICSSTASAEFTITEFALTEVTQCGTDSNAPARTHSNVVQTDDGKSMAFVLQKNQERITVPTVPQNVLLIGNSLLLGMFNTYGMCSSSPKNDYYHYVTQGILRHNGACTFHKLHGSGYEHSESVEAFDNWLYQAPNVYTGMPAIESFTEDLDLILVQLGDNINTAEKIAAFQTTVDLLLDTLKTHCPKARIIWISGWYNKSNT